MSEHSPTVARGAQLSTPYTRIRGNHVRSMFWTVGGEGGFLAAPLRRFPSERLVFAGTTSGIIWFAIDTIIPAIAS